jgi:hypothetical protein
VGHSIYRSACVICAIALTGFIADAAAQRRAGASADAVQQAVNVSLKVGGQAYQSTGSGKCTHAPVASIYQTVAELWSVQQSADGRSLTMSFWKPKDGSDDMVTLSVSSGGTAHQVNTVRGGGATSGSGKVTFQKSGNGATFTVDAKSGNGAAITGTIQCETFAPHTAEGG